MSKRQDKAQDETAASAGLAPFKAEPPPRNGWGGSTYAVPEFRGPDGTLKEVERDSFPDTPTGKSAWCDYMILVWTARKPVWGREQSEKEIAQAELDRAKKRLAKLEAKLKAL